MKRFLLTLMLIVSTITFAQVKKTQSIQPYSISNIKLGMTEEDFLAKYPDLSGVEAINNSTKTLFYDTLILNNIEILDVYLKFYKKKLIMFSFKTYDSKMHSGLSAKYGYRHGEEYESYEDGIYQKIGGYGKSNSYYDLFRVAYENGQPERFLMMDLKANKLAESEGF